MNPGQLMQAAQLIAKYQKDPEALKEYVPQVESVLMKALMMAKKHNAFANHVALMIDERQDKPALHVVDIDTDGHVQSLGKTYLSDFLNDMELQNVPEAIAMAKNEMTWAEISQKLMRSQPAKVVTFEETLLDMADDLQPNSQEIMKSSDNYFMQKLKPTLVQEFNTGKCSTLINLMNEHYAESDTDALLNWLKLDARWSEAYYEDLCWRFWNKDLEVMDELDELWQTNNKESVRDE